MEETKTYVIRESKVVYKNFKKFKSPRLTTPAAIFDLFYKDVMKTPFEQFIAIYVDSANNIVSFTREGEGSQDQAIVYPRKVAKNALLNDCTRVIFVHNHPSGQPRPSEHDIAITKKLQECLTTIDIETLDHIVIGDGNYYSFREHGLI